VNGGAWIIHAAVIAYAIYRVMAFHPVFNSEYRGWLETTPWTSRLPLPVGPVHLVPQDALILGILCGLAWLGHPGTDLLVLLLKFLFFYELCMGLSFASLRMPWHAYVNGFGLGFLCLWWNTPIVALKTAVALYSISFLGLRRALLHFHEWSDGGWLGDRQFHTLSLEKKIDLMKQRILGWPFDVLRPKEIAPTLKYRDGIMLSLLVGWWAFVVIHRIKEVAHDLTPVMIMVGFACQIILAVRLATYCWGYLPPISIWGRILTLRWIIPGYDRVFVAPLAGLLITVFTLTAFNHWQIPVDISAPATLTLVLLSTLNLGPSLTAWRLTGKHRISPGMLMMNNQADVKQI